MQHSIQTHTIKRVVHSTGRTIAEALREEDRMQGNMQAKQRLLIAQM
jgi:hypothetical protein